MHILCVVYYNQLLGAARTLKLVELLFSAIFSLFVDFNHINQFLFTKSFHSLDFFFNFAAISFPQIFYHLNFINCLKEISSTQIQQFWHLIRPRSGLFCILITFYNDNKILTSFFECISFIKFFLVPLQTFLVPLTGPVPAVEKCWIRVQSIKKFFFIFFIKTITVIIYTYYILLWLD